MDVFVNVGRFGDHGCFGDQLWVHGSMIAQAERTLAICALELQEQRLAMLAPEDEVAARLAREGARIGDVTISLVWNDESGV